MVGLLAKDADVGLCFAPIAVACRMRSNELYRLDEHAAGTAARIVHPALVGREHFNQQADDAAGRVELAAFLTFGAGELRQEVLVYPAEDVLGAVFLVAQSDVADKVDELAEPLLVEARVGVVLGQHAL